MIRPRLAILSMFVLLAETVGAKAVDKEKLRRAAHLPEISVIVSYAVNSEGDFTNQAEMAPQPEKIAELEKELKDDGTDPERYSRLAELYFRCGQSAKGK